MKKELQKGATTVCLASVMTLAMTTSAFAQAWVANGGAGETPVPQAQRNIGYTKVMAFSDVTPTAPYYDAVKWAVENEITAGATETTFQPNDTCTNGQILTFLWRANGQPVSNRVNPFTDVSESDYCYQAAVWAYEKGLVSGTTLKAEEPCTRSQTVAYLWGLAGKPIATKQARFSDVARESETAKAVAWAVEKGVTSGTSPTTFAPKATCTRGQIVTFLYRDLVKPTQTKQASQTPDFGSNTRKKEIYETVWLTKSSSFVNAYDDFEDYYYAFYEAPHEDLGVPHMKTQGERDAIAKQERTDRLAKRTVLEKTAMEYIQKHWIECGKTKGEADARKAQWKAEVKAVYANIDALEKKLLAEGKTKSEVENAVSSEEDMCTYGMDTVLTPEEMELMNKGMGGFKPVQGWAAAN